MRKTSVGVVLVLALAASVHADPGAAPASTAARKACDKLKVEWRKAYDAYVDGFNSVKSQADFEAAQKRYPEPKEWAPKFVAVADQNPKDPGAADCLAWVVEQVQDDEIQAKAMERLLAEWFESPAVGDAASTLGRSRAAKADEWLRNLIAKHPSADVQGQACYGLAKRLLLRVELADRLAEGDGGTRERAEKSYGAAVVDGLATADVAAMKKEAGELLDRIVAKHADATIIGSLGATEKAGVLAEHELFVLRRLAIGQVAPEIVGKDGDDKPIKLSDFRGKVVVLDFWSFG
jgi:hypothetical protein